MRPSLILKCCIAVLLLCPVECFNVFSLIPRTSTDSAALSLRRCHFEKTPRLRLGNMRWVPPLRSNLMGGADEPNESQDMPLAFYRSDNGTRNSEFLDEDAKNVLNNQYFQMISTLTPGEIVGQFFKSASPRVQEAVKKTIVSLLGTLRTSPAFDASIITSHRALASMMFQMEMTGYMFRNAEYRLGLQQSLARALPPTGGGAGEGGGGPKIEGKITVKMPGGEVKVDADSYVSELTQEVQRLRNEITRLREDKSEEKGRDLVAYIQGLEPGDMQALTADISPEVLQAMRLLVDSVMIGISGGPMVAGLVGPDSVAQLGSGALAQLCMWQLVVGYNLREMEARDALDRQLPSD